MAWRWPVADAYVPPRRRAGGDPARPPRYWAPEPWRLYCALVEARVRLPYATADARLIDGVAHYVVMTGKGRATPSPWWTEVCDLVAAMLKCVADDGAQRLLSPWRSRTPGAATAPGGFTPLGG